MDYLDLSYHDPEEYEGKLIEYNGCQYIIGSHINTGLDKIVHNLINTKSGLAHHAIKICRDVEVAKNAFIRTGEPKRLAGLYEFALYAIQVTDYGGMFEIQRHFNFFIDSQDSTKTLITQAEVLINQSEFEEAIRILSSVLSINNHHTGALHYMGTIYANTGDLELACNFFTAIISIEPNYESFYLNAIKCAKACGLETLMIATYEKMKSIFPYQCTLDELAIATCLDIGAPEQAKIFISRAYLLPKEKEVELINSINQDIDAKQAAQAILQQELPSITLYFSSESLNINVLEMAYTYYNKDRLLNINLGLSYRLVKKFALGRDLLLKTANFFPYPINIICVINAVFCEIELDNYSKAEELLELLAKYIHRSSLSTDALPGAAIWIYKAGKDYNYVAQSGSITLDYLNRITLHFLGKLEINEAIVMLHNLYKKTSAGDIPKNLT